MKNKLKHSCTLVLIFVLMSISALGQDFRTTLEEKIAVILADIQVLHKSMDQNSDVQFHRELDSIGYKLKVYTDHLYYKRKLERYYVEQDSATRVLLLQEIRNYPFYLIRLDLYPEINREARNFYLTASHALIREYKSNIEALQYMPIVPCYYDAIYPFIERAIVAYSGKWVPPTPPIKE